MPRTLKSKWARSYAYKRNKQQRGEQKIEDKASHHSHRNMNINANEITYVKFNCIRKSGGFNWGMGNQPIYNPADLKNALDEYDWKKETIVEFLQRRIEELQAHPSYTGSREERRYLDALKQLDRRGENKRFVSHGRRFKQMDQTY